MADSYILTATGGEVEEYELREQFADYIDELYGEAQIGWLTYSTALAIEELEPGWYDSEFWEWVNFRVENGDLIDADDYEDPEDEDEYDENEEEY